MVANWPRIGNSIAKRQFLPEPWTDFTAAVIAEEPALPEHYSNLLFAALLWRGLHIARQRCILDVSSNCSDARLW